jgi:hypothetical protein
MPHHHLVRPRQHRTAGMTLGISDRGKQEESETVQEEKDPSLVEEIWHHHHQVLVVSLLVSTTAVQPIACV